MGDRVSVFFKRFLRFGVGIWGVTSCFVLPTGPLIAGAGLGNRPALLWHRTFLLGFWTGFGVVPAYFVLPTSPAQYRAVVWGNRVIQLWDRTVSFTCVRFFRPADPPPPGARGDLGILVTSPVAQDCVPSCFLFSNFVFLTFPSTHSRPAPPFSGDDMAVVFVDVFSAPYG